ncbi:hypothetical protein KO317_02600 [Candidatus Micrarchaeota archaeon]|jgi:thymidine kinase|nr:hypothetical protein [Candidatus Micrarchaeota archaeon]
MAGNLIACLGPMFSGKTEELVRLVNREKYAGRTFKVYKPKKDNRYDITDVVTNNGITIPANVIKEDGYQIIIDFSEFPVTDIFIDEIQFFESKIIDHIRILLSFGKNIYYSGLSTTSENKPFPFKDADPNTGCPHMGDLLAGIHHSQIIVHNAFCSKCQAEAYFTHAIIEKTEAIKVGGKEDYEALCSKCYHEVMPLIIPDYYSEDIKEKIRELQRLHGWKEQI